MGTRGDFKVAITKEDLVFAAAHFITFAGHRCEKLHGHNYRASVVVEGGLEKDSWFVVDFSAIKKLMRSLTAELDHCVILPIPNTTVEMLAQYLAGRVRAELGVVRLKALEVEVEENFGQSASYREILD